MFEKRMMIQSWEMNHRHKKKIVSRLIEISHNFQIRNICQLRFGLLDDISSAQVHNSLQCLADLLENHNCFFSPLIPKNQKQHLLGEELFITVVSCQLWTLRKSTTWRKQISPGLHFSNAPKKRRWGDTMKERYKESKCTTDSRFVWLETLEVGAQCTRLSRRADAWTFCMGGLAYARFQMWAPLPCLYCLVYLFFFHLVLLWKLTSAC